jgi:choline dehydrogenase
MQYNTDAYSHKHAHLHRRQNATTTASNTTSEYDYVVVGSGAGGGPLAARLAQAGFSVLVLEAGEDMGKDIYTNVPALHFVAAEYLPMAWNFYVNHYPDVETQRRDSKMEWLTPDGQIWVQLLNGTTPPAGSEPLGIMYPRSGTVGGCSQHNAQIMVYPHPSDFQYIVDQTGDQSWAPDNMRQYFERLEKVEYLPNSIVGHGYDGWLATSLTDLVLIAEDLKVASLVLSAAAAMGKGLITSLLATVTGLASTLAIDLNNPTSARDRVEGMYQVPLSINAADKTRSGPRNFLYEVANAVNKDGSKKYKLDIQTTSLATKILFDTTSADKPIATGVEYLRGKSLYRADPRAPKTGSPGTPGSVTANREVIVSGGAFNTPQLLKLSGIGPADELSQFGIDVVVDLPGVGTNMQDRYEVPIIGKTTSDFALTKDCTFQKSQPDKCLDLYNKPGLLGRGVYGTSGAAFSVLKKTSSDDTDEPSLFMSGWPANFVGYFDGYSTFALQEKKYWSWLSLKAHSHNRAGTVTLKSADPRDTPRIDFNYFSQGADIDLQALVEGTEFSRSAFKKLIPLGGSFPEVQPGPEVVGDELIQYIKDEAWGHHASCSCPIGGDDDAMAVLDSKFRVRGVSGLRVVDASVFPVIPGYFVAVPIYMVAEKAAEDIINAAKQA